jgi:hypothetical protein
MTDPTLPGGRDRSMPRRLAAAAGMHLIALAIAASRMSAQPSRVAFDYRSELKPGHETTVVARGDFNGDGVPDLALAGPGHITIFEQGATSFDWKPDRVATAAPAPLAAVSGRLNADSRDDLVLLCGPRPMTAEIYLTDQHNMPVHASTIELPGDYRQMLIADPDADRDMDLLFFGKKTLGIQIYAGNGKGAFTEGPALFPELPVSQAAVAPMDGDNVPDLIVSDWLGNSVQVFPGFGAFNYGDPALLPLEDEPVSLAVGDMNGDRYRDIVAGVGERPGYVIFSGDGFGNYTASRPEGLDATPEKIRIGDIDGDARNDLLMFFPSAKSLAVRFQDAPGLFASQQTYSAGSSPADVVFFQDSRRKMLNAAVLSAGDDVVRLLHNRSAEAPEPGGLTLATGVDPADLEIADLNGDTWSDVVLLQGAEPVLSLFLNNGKGTLNGQSNLSIPLPATMFTALASPPGESDFLAAASDGATMSYVSLGGAALTAPPMTLRADAGIIPVDGRRLPGRSARRVYAMRGGTGEGDATVYAYDLTERTSHEEAATPLDIPGNMAAASVCDVDGDGRRDLAVLSAADTGSLGWVSFFRQGDDGFTLTRRLPFLFSDPAARPDVAFWVADLDADGNPDLVLNYRKPSNTLAVSMAAGDTAYGPEELIQTDVRVPGRKSLVVTDFDSDGKEDMVFVNERTRTVQFLPGNGKGRFEGPVNLTSARGVRGFGVADLNRDGEKELILSNSDLGVLTVTTFHHPLFVRKPVRGRD